MALLEAIVEACPLAIVVLDRNGIVRMWSRGAEEMLGLTESEAVGNPLPIPLELLESQLQTSSRKAIELTWRRQDGELLHVSSSGALLTKKGRFRERL